MNIKRCCSTPSGNHAICFEHEAAPLIAVAVICAERIDSHDVAGVVRENGAGKAGVTVHLSIGSATDVRSYLPPYMITAEDGSFSFGSLTHGTSYTITPVLTDYSFAPALAQGVLDDDLSLVFEATFEGEVPFEISGNVSLTDRPLAGVRVFVYLQGEDGESGAHDTVTDAEGNYVLEGLPQGEYEIVVEKDGLILGQRTVVSGGDSRAEANFSVDEIGLNNPTYALWNGYLGMVNIVEIINRGEESVVVELSLSGMNGQELPGAGSSRRRVRIPAGTEVDLMVNDLPGFSADQNGVLRVEGREATLDGRMTYYWAGEVSQIYDNSVSIPFLCALTDKSYTTFNTYSPDGSSAVANWLSLVNLSPTRAKDFSVRRVYYSPNGQMHSSETSYHVCAGCRRDVEAGHQSLGVGYAGTYEVIPEDSASPYLSALLRYGLEPEADPRALTFALGIPARVGNSAVQYAPVSTGPDLHNYVEISNLEDHRTSIGVKFYDGEGNVQGEETIAIASYGQRHLAVSGYWNGARLDGVQAGLVELVPQDDSRIIVDSANYFFAPGTTMLRSANVSRGQEPVGQILYGTYNLNLGMANWLRLINTSESSLRLTLTLNPGDPEPEVYNFKLGAKARTDLGLHEPDFSLTASYGVLRIDQARSGALLADVARTTPDMDITAVTAVR